MILPTWLLFLMDWPFQLVACKCTCAFNGSSLHPFPMLPPLLCLVMRLLSPNLFLTIWVDIHNYHNLVTASSCVLWCIISFGCTFNFSTQKVLEIFGHSAQVMHAWDHRDASLFAHFINSFYAPNCQDGFRVIFLENFLPECSEILSHGGSWPSPNTALHHHHASFCPPSSTLFMHLLAWRKK